MPSLRTKTRLHRPFISSRHRPSEAAHNSVPNRVGYLLCRAPASGALHDFFFTRSPDGDLDTTRIERPAGYLDIAHDLIYPNLPTL